MRARAHTHTHTECQVSTVSFLVDWVEQIKLSRKVFYHFVIFTIVNEVLIKDCQISVTYRQMQARGEMRSLSNITRRMGSGLLQTAIITRKQHVVESPAFRKWKLIFYWHWIFAALSRSLL